VVILLTPLSEPVVSQAETALSRLPHHFQLVQSHKQFHPHLLVVPIGSVVDFPNHDPFFHNVFSLFNGKRFDLGLYEAGITRSVKFDRAGVSYIFCNIHPQMSAVIITAQTPYYAVTDKLGEAVIRRVPDGRYRLSIWSEHALPKTLSDLTQEVTISGDALRLGLLPIRATADILANHKDMYGRDYDPVIPASSPYGQ
jgi:plastocyanin